MSEIQDIPKCTFAIMKPIETEKTQYDFSILNIKDIWNKDPEEQDSEIKKFINSLIDEFVEFKDLASIDFYDMVEDFYLKDNDFMKKHFELKNINFKNRRIYEDSKYCFRFVYPTSFKTQPETSNYLATVLENLDIIFTEVIVTKKKLETSEFESITKEDIVKIIQNKLMPNGIFLNVENKLCLEVGFYDRNFYNNCIGALNFVDKKNYYHDIDTTCGRIMFAYDIVNNKEKNVRYRNIKRDMSLQAQMKNENYFNYIMKFLSNILGYDKMNCLKNCILVYNYSMNGDDIPYKVKLNEFCKILELDKDFINRKEFMRINSTNDEKNNDFYIFKAIENIKLPFEEIKN